MKKLLSCGAALASALLSTTALAGDADTTTPIKHLIVVVGENVSFDALFGVYLPPRGRSVNNLLSEGIVTAAGAPGANYTHAVQWQAQDVGGQYTLNLVRTAPYTKLPQPYSTGELNLATYTYAPNAPDPRFASLTANGPFQVTKFVAYDSLTAQHAPATVGDPAHRFFQMWQQTGGTNARLDMFTWVATTTGTGGDSGFTPANPGQGGELMGFYNMSEGDAPVFKSLAGSFALSDNYHQGVMGGTGANFFELATGDLPVYANGGVTVPPANQIENPNPLPGIANPNFYTRDGYSGGSYVNCSDPSQPGVPAILAVLAAQNVASNCAAGAYYLVNNYNPGYDINGNPQPLGPTIYTYPPQTVPTIGELLSANGVSWKWYTGGRDAADVTSDPLYGPVTALVQSQVPPGTPAAYVSALAFQQTQSLVYNSLGDPLAASANVQANPALKANLKGLATFFSDVAGNTLPAVSFVVPTNLDSGHPGYSLPALYEMLIQELLAKVQANPTLWADTAILITTDEGGGYFDSGYIQNVDFFGDGTRIPLIVASPFVTPGYVDHTYNDHVSILKFIEANWNLPGKLSPRSRDNLPNPVRNPNNPYIPANQPAIGDLMTLFTFPATTAP